MPKKHIKKWLPHPDKVKTNPSLKFLGSAILDPNLWHLNRRSVSRAFFVGIFCAFLPIPFQMVVAAFLAILVHANLPLSVALVWITNPITIPPMFYFTYSVGAWLLDIPAREFTIQLSVDWVLSELGVIWQPLLLGSLICAMTFGSLGYLAMRLFWRWHVVKNWEARAHKKAPGKIQR